MTYDITDPHWDEQASVYLELFSPEAKGLVVLEHNDWGILEVIPAFGIDDDTCPHCAELDDEDDEGVNYK